MKQSAFLAVGVLLLFAAVATACKSSDTGLKNRVATVEAQLQQQNTAAQNAQIVLALQALASAGIHEFATSVDDGTLPAGESGPIQRALAAVAAAQWPSELNSQAQDMQTKLSDLLAALATDDITKIKGPADAAHELNDTFPDAVYEYLAGKLALPTPSGGGSETPMETPVATATP